MSWLIKIVLDWLLGKILAAIAMLEKDKAAHAVAVDQTKQDNEKASHINEESKSDDVDDAIADSLKHL